MTEETPDNVINLADAKASITDLAKLDPVTYGQKRKTAAKSIGISVSILDKEVQKRRRAPLDASLKNIILSERGAIVPILANAVEIMRQHPDAWNLKFEEFSQRVFIGDRPLEDADFLSIAEWIQRKGCHAGRRVTDDAVFSIASERKFHVVRDYLSDLKWDGTPRIDKILIDEGGAPDDEITQAMTGRILIQAVARIMCPGCQADSMFILEGAQGLRKSGFFEALSSPWYVSGLSDITSKDAKQELRGVWFIEMAELNTMHRSEVNAMKAFLTTRDDHYRESYGRVAKKFPRQCVFVGTVNPGPGEYLKDETGGRRFWPVRIEHEIDLKIIRTNRDQYWAEALHRFNKGELWYLEEKALEDAAARAQSERYDEDDWIVPIHAWLTENASTTTITTAEILQHVFKIEAAKWGRADQMRVGKCLGRLGWVKDRKRIDGKPTRRYTKVGTNDEVGTGGHSEKLL